MYFDFYDDRPDYLALNRDVARLEGLLHLIVAVSVAFFFDIVALIVLVMLASMPASDAARRAALVQGRQAESPRFVFMAPRVDRPSRTAPPNAVASDRNRTAAAPERSPNPTNSLPFSRGNTYERVEQRAMTAPPQRMTQPEPPTQGSQAQRPGQNGENGQNGSPSAFSPSGLPSATARNGIPGAMGAPGPLSAAVANPFRYAQGDVFNNPGGDGGQPQADIQFDSKGVEFGPWLRRFIAQLKRNWLIPMAAMTMKGHVVVTFYVHKDGSITEIDVPGPCPVQAFNRAAQGALVSSNPTQSLPPEYPADRCFFTVTFYYNEVPPYR
jgi:outer membrane biosynthesis protein TonB